MKTIGNRIKVGKLYLEAERIRKEVTDEAEIERIDRTEMFEDEIDKMIRDGEIIIININSKMRLGKSTAAMAIANNIIFPKLKKYGERKQEDKFTIKNIARDEQEFSKLMRDNELSHTVIVTDEFNAVGATGENSTTEEALTQTFSDVQAGRYVHRVCCSPKETVDPNADILLSVIGTDKRNKTTHCKIYYRYFEGGIEHTMLLGYIRINVANIISKWDEKGKELFFKKRTEQEQQELNKIAEQDWYTLYMIKKYEKMELITKEGIFRPRELDYAHIILQVVEELAPLARIHNLLNMNIIRNTLKSKMREAKIPQSIVGERLQTEQCKGILDLYVAAHKIDIEIQKVEERNGKGLMLIDEFNKRWQTLKKTKGNVTTALSNQLQTLERYEEINKRYEIC